MHNKTALGLLCFVVACYVIFSYSLTAPNLILTSFGPYWRFQTWMWQTFFNNRVLLSQVYTVLITGMWLAYAAVLFTYRTATDKLPWKPLFLLLACISLPLVLASNALSYDVFNYIFNAKMLVVYQSNPHQMVALDFAYDDWVRFMHNTHTPAPYGYGWTALSLIPYGLGWGKLITTWVNFRLFSWLSYILLAIVYWKTIDHKKWFGVWLVLLNPLLLLEIIGNTHNDLWMVVPALVSLLIVVNKHNARSALWLIISLVFLAASVSIKLATITLLPIWALVVAYYWLPRKMQKMEWLITAFEQWPWLASMVLFVPLFTERSKYFLPWYITWALVWIPFFHQPKRKLLALGQQTWICLLLGFTVSSLYRYLPYLRSGEYQGSVESHQILITWIGGLGLGLLLALLVPQLKKRFFAQS